MAPLKRTLGKFEYGQGCAVSLFLVLVLVFLSVFARLRAGSRLEFREVLWFDVPEQHRLPK